MIKMAKDVMQLFNEVKQWIQKNNPRICTDSTKISKVAKEEQAFLQLECQQNDKNGVQEPHGKQTKLENEERK